ncbi:MAG: PEP/pyruvate-binding domain-containing protein [Candidatus Hodarchaeales archaeon]|jgi:pyruvate,water dikinase
MSEEDKEKFLFTFRDLKPEFQVLAGGKGRVLAQLFQSGYPVPDGFIILPTAFRGNTLRPEAWQDVTENLDRLSRKNKVNSFAVRSSALNEDSVDASFAGEFETILNLRTKDSIKKAIHTVHQSRLSKRVQAYSKAKGVEKDHQIAIVVQIFIESEISGVIFSVDPITGNRNMIVGNYVYGGGDSLVSGESNSFKFDLNKRNGKYTGHYKMEKYSKLLYKLIQKLEAQFGYPQDIEFAIANRKVFILQSRPITTLSRYHPIKGEWNDSLLGDFIWTNVNSSEAVPNVLTPSTWSIFQKLYEEATPMKKLYKIIPAVGNIGGRLYFNLTLSYSLYKMTMKTPEALDLIEEVFGKLPPNFSDKLSQSFTKIEILKVIPTLLKVAWKLRTLEKELPVFLDANQKISREIHQKIALISNPVELITIWTQNLRPLLFKTFWMMVLSINLLPKRIIDVKHELIHIVGENDANTLVFNSGKQLASLGLILGISQVKKGELSREKFFEEYGHRGEDEFELSVHRQGENPDWLNWHLKNFQEGQLDIESQLNKQKSIFETAFVGLKAKVTPKRMKSLKKRIDEASTTSSIREAVRSEYARVFGLIRFYFLRSSNFLKLNEDIFFLTIDEVLRCLSGDLESINFIPSRKETINNYRDLPPYPAFIRGNFDPKFWAENPNRRSDFFDIDDSHNNFEGTKILTGFAGAQGIVRGTVRRLDFPEEGNDLKSGEILVTRTTNIGWSPLFPRVSGIITDVGAPLSHAAIIARELGIPAVVGCGTATIQLKTGDIVVVDGGKGLISILEPTQLNSPKTNSKNRS